MLLKVSSQFSNSSKLYPLPARISEHLILKWNFPHQYMDRQFRTIIKCFLIDDRMIFSTLPAFLANIKDFMDGKLLPILFITDTWTFLIIAIESNPSSLTATSCARELPRAARQWPPKCSNGPIRFDALEEASRALLTGRNVFPSVQPRVTRRYPFVYHIEAWSLSSFGRGA